ncbi:MAG: radical SAM/SPASM domain-containing protein [Bacilli bacterium]|nr:radical SAM/SPASM domain-containing protein [Bacilli bacterium]
MFKKIYIEITNICNLNCSFCPSNDRDKEFMSIDNFEHILKQIKGHTEYICLHVMGEPLMHPNLEQLLDKAYEYDLKVNLTTNGRLLKDQIDIINKAKSIRQINISLHSFDINNPNIINDLIKTIEDINHNYYISLRLWNLGIEDHNNDLVIKTFNDYYKVNNSNEKSIKLRKNLFINKDIYFEWPNLNKDFISDKGTCYGLRHHIGILVDGTVVPCCLDNNGSIKLGNIFINDFKSIINSEKCKEIKTGFENKKLIESLCKRCPYINRFNS